LNFLSLLLFPRKVKEEIGIQSQPVSDSSIGTNAGLGAAALEI